MRAGEKQNSHIVMFPEELPKRLIKMFSFVGDTILDTFLGSGIITLAARKLQRNSIEVEINPNYLPIIKNRVGISQGNLFKEDEFKILKIEKKENNAN